MIRITLVRDAHLALSGKIVPTRVFIKEFDDIGTATSWLVEDSYFSESYTRSMTWERIP